MDVLADLFHDGIAAFGEQLFVFGYQVVAVGINRDNQRRLNLMAQPYVS